jgi:ATP-binding cassette subfamily F protein uup
MIIDFKDVSFSYTDKPILDKVNFTLTDQDKTGLVGVNGTGKSTILKLIIGDEKEKGGQIIKSGNMIISYLSQDPYIKEGQTFLEYVMSSSSKEHPVLEYEANSAITKMKLDPKRIVSNLSGGEKKRLALAKTLVTYCDFLLLDEPTNHLDNDMIIYLEKYLERFKHGLLMVTHDRYFLEKCCDTMFELDNAKIYSYKANYTRFLELKALRIENQNKVESKLKKYLAQELDWLHRGVEARRTKSKSRIERYEELSKTKFSQTKSFEFSSVKTYLGKNIIEIKNASKGYNGRTLFSDFSLDVLRTDHIGIIGDNGCGKSTLFKTIMGLEPLDSGEIKIGETLNIGYFSQHFDEMDPDMNVLKYIEKDSNKIETLDGEMSAKALLNRFLFDDELLYTPIRSLSG